MEIVYVYTKHNLANFSHFSLPDSPKKLIDWMNEWMKRVNIFLSILTTGVPHAYSLCFVSNWQSMADKNGKSTSEHCCIDWFDCYCYEKLIKGERREKERKKQISVLIFTPASASAKLPSFYFLSLSLCLSFVTLHTHTYRQWYLPFGLDKLSFDSNFDVLLFVPIRYNEFHLRTLCVCVHIFNVLAEWQSHEWMSQVIVCIWS